MTRDLRRQRANMQRREAVPPDPSLDLHFILDNYATHKHTKVKAWLERHLTR